MGCGADPKAADAFFKFNVDKQTDVTIDTLGSALDTVLAIYPGNATVFGTNYAKDAFNQSSAATTTAAAAQRRRSAPRSRPAVTTPWSRAGTRPGARAACRSTSRCATTARRARITCANAGRRREDHADARRRRLRRGAERHRCRSAAPARAAPTASRSRTWSRPRQENGTQIGCNNGTLDNGGSRRCRSLGGQDYYVMVKGNARQRLRQLHARRR